MKIISFSAKCSDMFGAQLRIDGKEISSYDGYVPSWFPEGGGDYVTLDIDIETGQIVNWKKPTQTQLDETFKAEGSKE